jgi:hypothetical protein
VDVVDQRDDEDQPGASRAVLDAAEPELDTALVLLEDPDARGEAQQHQGDDDIENNCRPGRLRTTRRRTP